MNDIKLPFIIRVLGVAIHNGWCLMDYLLGIELDNHDIL